MDTQCSYIIIDDEPKAVKILQKKIAELYPSLSEVGYYNFWIPALDALQKASVDLLFLDISMPQKNGFNLLDLLPGIACEVVFVTAHEEFALIAFNHAAAGYIVKPIKDEVFIKTVDKALERIYYKKLSGKHVYEKLPHTNDVIGIHSNKGVDYLQVGDIVYFEATLRCTKIVTNSNTYMSSYNIGRFKTLIDEHKFFQIHRSYVINLKYVKRYESSGVIVMKDGHELPVSKKLRENFLKQFSNIMK